MQRRSRRLLDRQLDRVVALEREVKIVDPQFHRLTRRDLVGDGLGGPGCRRGIRQ